MKNLKRSPVKLTVFLFCIPFFSHSEAPQGDTPYLQSPVTHKLELIISESYQPESHFIHKYSQQFYKKYGNLFSDSPYYTNFLIFISPKKQTLNGKVSVSPLPLIHIYSNASHVIDRVVAYNWLQDSLAHEMAHMYQLNSQEKTASWLRLLLPVSEMTYHNTSLHNLILEGSAVLMESLYGTGGRLFSGWARAFVFSQIKHQVPLKRIFNNSPDPFSTKEKYLHGGYFFAYLLKNHSLKKINQIFSRQKDRIFLLMGMQSLNQLFYKNFSESFPSLFKRYQEFYLPEALKQKSSTAPVLWTSGTSSPLNSDKDRIYLLISDEKNPPQLVILNKKTLSVSKEKKDIPVGKVFFIENSFYSTGTGLTDTLTSETSLFKEGYIPLEKYNSRYVMDTKGNTTISFRTDKGPLGFPLYVNDSFYDLIQSTAVMDEAKNIYYFKQNKNTRTLYRNKTPLWSFKGYYSFPVEADKQGVYFIGPTKYGSGLFVFKHNQVFRLSSSDTIITGRKVNSRQFLVSEIGPYHYNYKIINLEETKEEPSLYKYNFKKPHNFQALLKKIQNQADSLKREQMKNTSENKPHLRKVNVKKSTKENPQENLKNLKSKEENVSADAKKNLTNLKNISVFHSQKSNDFLKPPTFHYYNSLTNLKFRNTLLVPFIRFSSPFIKGIYIEFSFIDPLQYNLLSFSGFKDRGKKAGKVRYAYKRYRPLVELKYQFENSPLIHIKNKTDRIINNIKALESEKLSRLVEELFGQQLTPQISSYKTFLFDLSVKYPLIKKENWDLSFISLVGLGKESFTLSSTPSKKSGKHTALQTGSHRTDASHKTHSTLFFNHKSKLQFDYEKKYTYAFSRHKYLNLGIYYDSLYLQNSKKFYFAFGTEISFEKEAGKEWYLSGGGKWERSMKKLPLKQIFKNNEQRTLWSSHSFIIPEQIRGYHQVDLALKKVLNQSLSFLHLPVSLKRWAPLTGVSLVSILKNRSTSNPYFINIFGGGEFELSFNHKLDVFAGFSAGWIYEFKNFKNQRDHGLHGSLFLKAAF